MTATDPGPEPRYGVAPRTEAGPRLGGRGDGWGTCPVRMRNMTSHDTWQGGLVTPHDKT